MQIILVRDVAKSNQVAPIWALCRTHASKHTPRCCSFSTGCWANLKFSSIASPRVFNKALLRGVNTSSMPTQHKYVYRRRKPLCLKLFTCDKLDRWVNRASCKHHAARIVTIVHSSHNVVTCEWVSNVKTTLYLRCGWFGSKYKCFSSYFPVYNVEIRAISAKTRNRWNRAKTM